jgi:glycosyltransferase involved in cell wall biosynthesis
MKILMIDAGGWGGITHYTYNLIRALSQDASLECVLLTDTAYELDFLPRNFRMIKAGFNGRAYPVQVAGLVKTVLAVRPAVIHVQTLFTARKDWLLFLLCRWLGIKIILTAHNVMPHEEFERKAFFMRRAMRIMYASCRAIIAHSAFSREQLMRSFGVPAGRIRIIPHGNYLFARTAEIPGEEARRQLGIPQGKTVFLHFGALRRYKGIDVLLEAFKQLRLANESVFLVLAGKPMHLDEEYFRRLIAGLGLQEDVLFKPGYVHFKDIAAFFFASDAAVFPYIRTDTSGALQLAYAFGKPVIATQVGGIPEDVENNRNGILVAPGDPLTLKLGMEVLVSHPQSLVAMGRRSFALAQERFSWTRIAVSTAALYRESI